jgi:uncharacterized membrane protein YdjX (TVP38/TMEM64 family)
MKDSGPPNEPRGHVSPGHVSPGQASPRHVSPGRVSPGRVSPRRVPLRVLALGALMLATILLCALALQRRWVRPDTIQSVVSRSGSLGMAAFVAAVVLMELLWLPRMWGLLAGGLLFGPIVGALLSIVADLIGGTACYLLARSAGRAWIARLLERRPRASRIVELLAVRRGAVAVAVLRVCPVAHYTLVSYAAGLSGVRPASFLLGTGVGLLPGAIIYPIAGDAALRPGRPAFLIALGLVAVMLVATLLVARRILRE